MCDNIAWTLSATQSLPTQSAKSSLDGARMFLERSTTFCLDFELVQLSWAKLISAAQWLFCKFENFTSFCLLLFALAWNCVFISPFTYQYDPIEAVQSLCSLLSALLLRLCLCLSLQWFECSCSAVPVSVCCLFNWLDCLSLMACAGHDATRRDDVGRLCQRRRFFVVVVVGSDLLWLASAPCPPTTPLPAAAAMSNVMFRVHFRLHASPTTAASRNYAFKRVQNNQLVPL